MSFQLAQLTYVEASNCLLLVRQHLIMCDYMKTLHEAASKKWPGLQKNRFSLLALYFPVKNCMSMLGAKGSDEIPPQLLKELESLHLSSAGGRTWGAWFWHNLPRVSRDLYQLDDNYYRL